MFDLIRYRFPTPWHSLIMYMRLPLKDYPPPPNALNRATVVEFNVKHQAPRNEVFSKGGLLQSRASRPRKQKGP